MSERAALRWGLVLAALWAAVALWVVHPEVVGLYHDDGIYVATAKSLAEGHGYRLIDLPGAPAQTKYPPLFPLALSLIWRAAPEFPGNVIWFKTFGILCTAAALVLFQRVALRSIGLTPAASVAALAVTIFSPRLLASANWVLAEPLFGMVTALALLVAARPETHRDTERRAVLAGALAGAAVLVRVQGLALIGALPLALLLERRRRMAAIALGASVLPVAAWFAWTAMHVGPASPLLTYYTSYASTVSPWSYGNGWASLPSVVLDRLSALPGSLGALMIGDTPGKSVAGAILLAAAFWGAVLAMARGRWLMPLVAGSALLLTLLVPWPPNRFLLPYLPLLVGLAVLAIPGTPGPGRWAGVLLASVVALAGAGRCALGVLSVERTSLPDANSLSSGRGDWPGWLESASWLAEHATDRAVLASHLDTFYYLFSGHQGVRFAPFRPLARSGADGPETDPRQLLSELRTLRVGLGHSRPGRCGSRRCGSCRPRPRARDRGATRGASAPRLPERRPRPRGLGARRGDGVTASALRASRFSSAGQSPAISPRRRRRSRWATIWRSASGWMPGGTSG